ncbi:hypothetical protein [Staphylococcus pseudintermedius]|uniref:hypothetical protein n=1 Tax=Staphylococcus pseudintermedius TaxID=283734 RepID=UPI00286DD05A|nr:hypothetical protein [Staphylococcus pseudintermedius]WMZ88757.1 hypothetical protein QS436_12670 [Staphylococcus pseudintermedius]
MKNLIAWFVTAAAAFTSTLFLALSGVYFTTLFVLVILIEISMLLRNLVSLAGAVRRNLCDT